MNKTTVQKLLELYRNDMRFYHLQMMYSYFFISKGNHNGKGLIREIEWYGFCSEHYKSTKEKVEEFERKYL